MTNNRRIIQHDDNHYDIEELRLVESDEFEYVWAVIYCSLEDEMTFTFSSNEEVDYPALGMCPVCAVRFTHGCEHSNTIEAQEWLAAHAVAEQPVNFTEQEATDIHNLIAAAESTEGFTDAWCWEDELVDTGLNDDRPYRAGNADGDLPL